MDSFISIPRLSSVFTALGVVCATLLSAFIVKLYLVRSKTLQMQREGLAMPPVHPIFGHLLFINKILSRLPKDAHPHYLPDQIRRELPDLGPIYYIDAWPFLTSTLVVASPSTLYQITQEHVLPKFPAIRDFLYPLAGGQDLVGMDGREWKSWRSVFNPGFSAGNIMTLVPGIVEDTMTFCRVLEKHVEKQDVFEMKKLTDNLAMDIIGRVVFDKQLNAQEGQNKLVNSMRAQMQWLAFGNEGFPLHKYHPLRPFILAYHTYHMNSYLSPELDSRFAHHQSSASLKGSKSVIDLALTAYLSTQLPSTHSPTLDPTFKTFLTNQIKLFLFSGHDTTSSTICYILHLLSTHPPVLHRLRAEHTTVFGPTPSHAPALIAATPHLLNQLPYTLAVAKEAMRLFPAASTTRAGEPAFHITAASGVRYPTAGHLVWLVPHAVQRDPAFWPQPDEFLPYRWLALPGEPLYPVKGAWRPFEHGPRACIGQELSVVEMKVVMVLVARRFELSSAYEELDRGRRGGVKVVDGERAYQVQHGQPSGNLPCRVRRVEG